MRRYALALISLTYWLANTMLRPLVAPYAASEGADPAMIGLILAASAVPAFVLAVPTGALTDRFGDRPFLIGGGALMAAGVGLYVAGAGFAAVAGGQALFGIGALAVWLCIQRLMIDGGRSGEENDDDEDGGREERDRRIATYSTLGVIGQLTGPALGGVLADHGGYHVAFAVLVGITVLMFAFTWAVPRPVRRADASGRVQRGARRVVRDVGRSYATAVDMMKGKGVVLTMAVSFVGLYLLDVRTAFQPLYFDSVGLSPSTTGYLLSLASVCALVARPLLVAMRRRMRSGTIVAVCLIPGALAVGSVVFVDDPVSLAVLSAVSGLSLGLTSPLTLSLTADFTSRDERGVGIGLRLVANRMSQWTNPALFSLLLAMVGIGPAFLVTTAALVVIAALVAWRLNVLTGPLPR